MLTYSILRVAKFIFVGGGKENRRKLYKNSIFSNLEDEIS